MKIVRIILLNDEEFSFGPKHRRCNQQPQNGGDKYRFVYLIWCSRQFPRCDALRKIFLLFPLSEFLSLLRWVLCSIWLDRVNMRMFLILVPFRMQGKWVSCVHPLCIRYTHRETTYVVNCCVEYLFARNGKCTRSHSKNYYHLFNQLDCKI